MQYGLFHAPKVYALPSPTTHKCFSIPGTNFPRYATVHVLLTLNEMFFVSRAFTKIYFYPVFREKLALGDLINMIG